jgi:hypothetical protein
VLEAAVLICDRETYVGATDIGHQTPSAHAAYRCCEFVRALRNCSRQ